MKSKLGRPKGAKDRPAPARPFAVKFDASRKTWLVRQGKNWHRASEVSILAAALSTSSGEIVGEGVVTKLAGTRCVVITS